MRRGLLRIVGIEGAKGRDQVRRSRRGGGQAPAGFAAVCEERGDRCARGTGRGQASDASEGRHVVAPRENLEGWAICQRVARRGTKIVDEGGDRGRGLFDRSIHVQSAPVLNPRRLLLFTKPARAGKVKTRLIGDLTPEQAAKLHAAFVDDVLARLTAGAIPLTIAWALEAGDEIPSWIAPSGVTIEGVRQQGADLGARLFRALVDAGNGAGRKSLVAAIGSDHPTVPLARVEEAFARLERGADVAIGPAQDGGYYLIAVRSRALRPRLFEEIAWSTSEVLPTTLERCRELGLQVELLETASDVDTPEDLARLAGELARDAELAATCPLTRDLLASWGRLRERGGQA